MGPPGRTPGRRTDGPIRPVKSERPLRAAYTPPVSDDPTRAGEAAARGIPRALPYRLGDYELQEEIARGAMGVVFKARQLSLNRVVAIKLVLASWLASDEQAQRFQTEARASCARSTGRHRPGALEPFRKACERLRSLGYRPTQIRPFGAVCGVDLAAVLVLDGRSWQVQWEAVDPVWTGSGPARAAGLLPVDHASYVVGRDALALDRDVLVLAEAAPDLERWVLLAGQTVGELVSRADELLGRVLRPVGLRINHDRRGVLLADSVWHLSEAERLSESEMCYPPLDRIGPEMLLEEGCLERTGYRLPSEAEREYACRAAARPRLPRRAHPALTISAALAPGCPGASRR